MTDPSIELLVPLVKEFLFLKFHLKGIALIKEVESPDWQKKLETQQPTQILEALSLLEAQTLKEYTEKKDKKKLEELKIEEPLHKPYEPWSGEFYRVLLPNEEKEKSTAPLTLKVSSNQPKDTAKPKLVTVKLMIETGNNNQIQVKSNWFSLLKAAAIFPYECDPVDYLDLMMMFQYRHIHIQLARASQLGYWDARDYLQRLGSYCEILPDHPIRQEWQKNDPFLKSGGIYKTFQIYQGDDKQRLTIFDQSKEDVKDFIDLESMTDEEKSQHMKNLYEMKNVEMESA